MVLCEICNKLCKDRRGLSRHLQLLHHWNNLKEYYDKYIRLYKEGFCLTCGNETKFNGLTSGYSNFCHSMKCISNNVDIKIKKEKSCINHCGETTNLKCQNTKLKIKQTNKEKTGYDNPSKNPEIKNKKLITAISHFGSHQSKSEIIKNKKIQTSILHFNVDHHMKIDIIKFKVVNSFKNHKIQDSLFLKRIKDKTINTNRERYNSDYWSQTKEGILFHRLIAIKYIENQQLHGEPLSPRIGILERSCLDDLQNYTVYKIIRNDQSFRYKIGRYPDGHILELKFLIQYNERHHYLDQKMLFENEKTFQTTKDFESIGYLVFNISEYEWKNNKEKIIDQFINLIKGLQC